MGRVHMLFSAFVEGCIFGVSYVLLFVPLLYLGSHRQRVLYGAIMTVVLTIMMVIMHFFRVVRPITHLSHVIKKVERRVAAPRDGLNLLLGGDGGTCDDLADERRYIEKTLHVINVRGYATCYYVQEQYRVVAELLMGVLKWKNDVLRHYNERRVERVGFLRDDGPRCDGCSLRQNSVGRVLASPSPSISMAAPSTSKPVGGSPARLVPELTVPATAEEESQRVTVKGDCRNSQQEEQEQHGGQGEKESGVSSGLPNALQGNLLGSTPSIYDHLPMLSSVNGGRPCPQPRNRIHCTKKKGKSDVEEEEGEGESGAGTTIDTLNSTGSSAPLVDQTQQGKLSVDDGWTSAHVDTASTFLQSASAESIFAMREDNAPRRFRSIKPPRVTLLRGSRFAGDNLNVFFHLTVKRANAPDAAVGFEAFLEALPSFREFIAGPRRRLEQWKLFSIPESSPFVGYVADTTGKRAPLDAKDEALLGFATCEREEEEEEGGNSTIRRLNMGDGMTPHARRKDGADAVCDKRPAFILSWAVLPDLPMRLTTLQVRLTDERIHTLPVLECLIADVFSILTAAVVRVRSSGMEGHERAVSVELHGLSIEDATDEDGSDLGTCMTTGIGGFGMPVSSTINL